MQINPAVNYRLMSLSSGQVAEVADNSEYPGAIIQQNIWQNATNQKWRLTLLNSSDTEQYYQITSVSSGLVMAVADASKNPGYRIIQWSWSNGDEQKWRPTSVDDSCQTFKLQNKNSQLDLAVPESSLQPQTGLVQWTSLNIADQDWILVQCD